MTTAYQALQALAAPNGLGAGMANLFAAILESNANKKREEQSKADRARQEALQMADRAQAQRNADREAADRAVQRKQQLDIATAKAQQDALQLQQKQLFEALNTVAGGSGAQADAANAKLAEMAGPPAQQKDATWNSIGQGLMNALGQALQGQTPVANAQQSGTMQPNANAGSQNKDLASMSTEELAAMLAQLQASNAAR